MSLDPTELATTAIELRNAAWLARAFPLFKDLEPHLLEALAAEIDWFAIQGGTTLFQAGDEPDALYCVFSGSLGAYASSEEGHRRLVGRIQAGDSVLVAPSGAGLSPRGEAGSKLQSDQRAHISL